MTVEEATLFLVPFPLFCLVEAFRLAAEEGQQQQQEEEEEEEEDLSTLHPGALLYRSAGRPNFLAMADALAHGADVNWLNAASASR
ncbi:unnamed protein product [Gadus morhua 'NCC']